MKINVDIDCTPQEARTFLGLPDVEKMQEAVMAQLQARMMENINSLDPESMMKTWLPAGIQGMEQMQKMFLSQFGMDPTKK
ncbi:DUF6489 family protein [Sneathiella marina]|uniref:DUF6489 family protein n=1 Tax=Sneathiella marina TaxID=2950108 RepID=A0ABY4W5L7_9PROT|nr:DUF6489 family protein [Sneathiella marina]USG61403.1 DUF6489 family protein [Sneathiella marina]